MPIVLSDVAQVLIGDLDQIASRIATLYEQLSEARRGPAQLARELKNLELRIADREAEIMAEVAVETVGDSVKPVFSNDTVRKAEAKKRCGADSKLIHLNTEKNQLERAKLDADMRIGQTEDLVKATVAVKDIKVAEAGLLTAMIAATAKIQKEPEEEVL